MKLHQPTTSSLLLAILLVLGTPALADLPLSGPRDGRPSSGDRSPWSGPSNPIESSRAGDSRRDDTRRDDNRRDDTRRDDTRRDDNRRDDTRRDDNRRDDTRRDESWRDRTPPRVESGFRFDSRYRHDRYYPPRGHVVDRLPSHPIEYRFLDSLFFFHSGIWYRPDGPRFIVTSPPVGIGVSVLPPYYTTVWLAGVPYYYADDVYYTWRPDRREYVVVDPPSGADAYVPPATPEQLFVYPKEGQDEATVASDRYQCHRWAVDQSGFDPVQPDANLSSSDAQAKRADYQRATKACLEARGYSVR